MEWLLEQIGRLTNFLSSASEDIEDFTVVGAVALLVLQAVFS